MDVPELKVAMFLAEKFRFIILFSSTRVFNLYPRAFCLFDMKKSGADQPRPQGSLSFFS